MKIIDPRDQLFFSNFLVKLITEHLLSSICTVYVNPVFLIPILGCSMLSSGIISSLDVKLNITSLAVAVRTVYMCSLQAYIVGHEHCVAVCYCILLNLHY